jgi:hypothetical protein
VDNKDSAHRSQPIRVRTGRAPTTPSLSVEEVTKQRNIAIRNLAAAIADHDFINARRYSNEEALLKHTLQELQDGPLATHRKLA